MGELNIRLVLTDAAVDHILAEAHDPELGARPLKRYLERHLVAQLSVMILKGELLSDCVAHVDWAGGKWHFSVKRAEAAANSELSRVPSATLGRAGSRNSEPASP